MRPLTPLTLFVGVVLSGCVAAGRDVEVRPPESLPAQFVSASETPAAAAAPEPNWWRAFGDRRLDGLVEEALAHNPSLQAAAANVEAALAQARIEGAALAPQASVGLNSSRRKQNFIGFPIPGAEGNVLSTTASNQGLSLNVSWEADLWGRLRAQKRAAVLDAAAAAEDLQAARLSVAGQVTKAYLGLVELTQQVALSERTVKSREDTQTRVEARYRRGLSPSFEVRQARTQVASIRASLLAQQRQQDALRRQLEILVGRYPASRLESLESLPALPAPVGVGLPADLLSRRPDLRAAEKRALSASSRLQAARRALYPSLSLTGSTGTTSGELSDLLDGDFSVWSLAGSLLQPLFQGGRLRANARLSEAGLDQTEARWLESTLLALSEVEIALHAEEVLRAQIEALGEAAEQSTEAERLALDRYREGLADYLSVLDSQRTSFQAESQLLVARRQLLENRVDLVLAVGGGLETALTEN